MEKINFIKTFIPQGDFREKYEHGGMMVRHLAAVLDEKMGAYECYECTVPIGEYDEGEIQKVFVEFSVKMDALKLKQAKVDKIAEIAAYDASTAVNGFKLGGTEMWLSFDERARIRQSIDAYRGEGRTEMTKWFNGKAFTFTLDTWQTMLDKLSVYASEALNVTERHKAKVKALTSIEAVEKYDYKTGYPEKLSFANTSDATISK